MTGPEEQADLPPEQGASGAPPVPALERLRLRLSAGLTRNAPRIVSIDGVLVFLIGIYALISSLVSYQGEGFLLVIGGLALLLFGFMMVLRWNLPLVRIGLVGMTAGYFASALQEFQVATDPCDIGATFERCVGVVPGGIPWLVYQGPLVLAVLLFILIAFEPATRGEQHE